MTITPATIKYNSRVKCIKRDGGITTGKIYPVREVFGDRITLANDKLLVYEYYTDYFTPCNEDGSDIVNESIEEKLLRINKGYKVGDHVKYKGAEFKISGIEGIFLLLNNGGGIIYKTTANQLDLDPSPICGTATEEKPKKIEKYGETPAPKEIPILRSWQVIDKLNELIDVVNSLNNKH